MPSTLLLPEGGRASKYFFGAGWKRHAQNVPNNAAGGKKKGRETEVLWGNFV
jgi:hypothetical protein